MRHTTVGRLVTAAFAAGIASTAGTVGVTDFLDMLAAWGPNPGHPADFDGDGEVGVTDFLALPASWGPCP